MPPRASGRNVPRRKQESTDESGSDSDDGRGASAAVQWVACDKCSQWRKLSGLTDLKSLPKKWFCKLNPDQNYNDCSIPQEEEEDPEQRLRAHLRLWARRLKLADEAETRLPMAHGTRAARRTRGVGEQEWVRCCDPNCGKWRALHRSMDCSNLGSGLDKEWYCVMNSWDEALASCAAPQEVPSEAHHVQLMQQLGGCNGGGMEYEDDPRARKISRRGP